MGYRIVAEGTMTVHFLVLAFLVVGGFAAWRWRWVIWPHLALAGWVGLALGAGLTCPLTTIENWGRTRAGAQGIGDGFIAHYLTGVIYPAHDLGLVRAVVALVVAGSWLGLGLRWHATRRPPSISTSR